MANLYPTLLDLKNVLQPGDAGLLDVAEVLVEENEIMNHLIWHRGNTENGDMFAVRSAMPAAEIRRVNAGVPATTTKKNQKTVTCMTLEAKCAIDSLLLSRAPDKNEFRALEARPFIASLGEAVAATLFFGDDEGGIDGFYNYYSDLKGETKDQIIDFGGTDEDHLITSIMLVKWDPAECTCIYPRNMSVGLEKHVSYDVQLPQTDDPTRTFRGDLAEFRWTFGLRLRDPRYCARVCNIDVDDLQTDEAARQKLFEALIRAKNKVRHASTGRLKMYVSPELYSMLEVAAFNKSNMALGYRDIEGDTRVLHFSGVPVCQNDCMAGSEQLVA